MLRCDLVTWPSPTWQPSPPSTCQSAPSPGKSWWGCPSWTCRVIACKVGFVRTSLWKKRQNRHGEKIWRSFWSYSAWPQPALTTWLPSLPSISLGTGATTNATAAITTTTRFPVSTAMPFFWMFFPCQLFFASLLFIIWCISACLLLFVWCCAFVCCYLFPWLFLLAVTCCSTYNRLSL